MDRLNRESLESIDEELENARIGYQVAVSMTTGLLDVIWSIFNAMIVANSIVVAGIIMILNNHQTADAFKIIVVVIGLLLCLFWFLIVRRQNDYAVYYLMSAREIEEKYLKQSIKTLSRGGLFAQGKEITLQINDTSIIHCMSFWSQLLNGKKAAYIIILVFVVIYIGILFI